MEKENKFNYTTIENVTKEIKSGTINKEIWTEKRLIEEQTNLINHLTKHLKLKEDKELYFMNDRLLRETTKGKREKGSIIANFFGGEYVLSNRIIKNKKIRLSVVNEVLKYVFFINDRERCEHCNEEACILRRDKNNFDTIIETSCRKHFNVEEWRKAGKI